jgi:hypothetical protein
MKPQHGVMYWWRAKGKLQWHFGYCIHVSSGLVRMGFWNGDDTNGPVLDPADIEWKPYN